LIQYIIKLGFFS